MSVMFSVPRQLCGGAEAFKEIHTHSSCEITMSQWHLSMFNFTSFFTELRYSGQPTDFGLPVVPLV